MKLKSRYVIATAALLLGLPLAALLTRAMPALARLGIAVGDSYSRVVGSALSADSFVDTAKSVEHVLEGWSPGSLMFWSVVGGALFIAAMHTWCEDEVSFAETVRQRWVAAIKAKNTPEVIGKFAKDYAAWNNAPSDSVERTALWNELNRNFALLTAGLGEVDSTNYLWRFQGAAFLGAVLFSFGSPVTFVLGWGVALCVIAWAIANPKETLELRSWQFVANRCS